MPAAAARERALGERSLLRLWDAPSSRGLGSTDFLVIAAFAEGPESGRTTADAMDALTDAVGPVRAATLYAAIDKLVGLGLLSVSGSVRSPAGGRPSRVLRMTASGLLAVDVGVGMAESLGIAPGPTLART